MRPKLELSRTHWSRTSSWGSSIYEWMLLFQRRWSPATYYNSVFNVRWSPDSLTSCSTNWHLIYPCSVCVMFSFNLHETTLKYTCSIVYSSFLRESGFDSACCTANFCEEQSKPSNSGSYPRSMFLGSWFQEDDRYPTLPRSSALPYRSNQAESHYAWRIHTLLIQTIDRNTNTMSKSWAETEDSNVEWLYLFGRKTCRSELTHWNSGAWTLPCVATKLRRSHWTLQRLRDTKPTNVAVGWFEKSGV